MTVVFFSTLSSVDLFLNDLESIILFFSYPYSQPFLSILRARILRVSNSSALLCHQYFSVKICCFLLFCYCPVFLSCSVFVF